ncbi:MAG: hypothetical protein Q8Q17_02915 [bacterium]|nr:hypothetical protein [bacterium]
MDNLFLLLFFVSIICLIVGLVKPSAFSRYIRGEITRKKIWLIFGGSVIVFFVLFSATTNTSKNSQVAQKTPTTNIEETQKSTSPVTANKTDQQILEENLASIVGRVGDVDMSYRGLQIEKTDPDRPKDVKMVTVSVNVKSFYNKNSLLQNTGKLSSLLFKAVYDVSSIKAYDVLVWYYAETTDKYGNKKDNVVLTYAIDKITYGKINWQNFDQSNLCDFLKQEAKALGTFDTACNVLANIQ